MDITLESSSSAKGLVHHPQPVALASRPKNISNYCHPAGKKHCETLRSCGIWCWLAAAWRLATRAWKSRVCEWRRSIAWAKLLKSIPVVIRHEGRVRLCRVVGWWMMDGCIMVGWLYPNFLFTNHRGPLPKLRPFSELQNLIVQHRSSRLQLHAQMRIPHKSGEGTSVNFWYRWVTYYNSLSGVIGAACGCFPYLYKQKKHFGMRVNKDCCHSPDLRSKKKPGFQIDTKSTHAKPPTEAEHMSFFHPKSPMRTKPIKQLNAATNSTKAPYLFGEAFQGAVHPGR